MRRLSTLAVTGLVLSGGAIATAAASHAATPPAVSSSPATPATNAAAHNPHGDLLIRVVGRRVVVRGNADDPDTTRAVRVIVSFNGKKALVRASHAGHSFARTFVLPYGRYAVTAQAINIGPGTASPVIGRQTIALVNPASHNPRGTGYLIRSGSAVRFTGHVSDPDAPKRSVAVHVYDNGRMVAAGRTNGQTRAYSLSAQVGAGVNRYGVVAFNLGRGTGNPYLGRFTVNRPRPWVDSYQGVQRIAATLVAAHGWGPAQMADLVKLWNKESGWRVNAANPSGAYGIPQALPGSKMGASGPNWQSDARTQIAWGLSYIAGRYGSPSAAWAHSVATNWY
ncbi:MAG: hypothetical protein JWO63_396 [Frankiales bacterium]|nr:hypothetical protein [Frankiales bacterium]